MCKAATTNAARTGRRVAARSTGTFMYYLDKATRGTQTSVLATALVITVAFLILCLVMLYLNMAAGRYPTEAIHKALVPPTVHPVFRHKLPETPPSFFRPIFTSGMVTFSNVCVEATSQPESQSVHLKNGDFLYNETKRITVYDASWDGDKTFHVAGSSNGVWNHWHLNFRKNPVPPGHRYRVGQTAYFISPTCPANLHHFWEDELGPLYGVVSITGSLNPRVPNQLFYRTPWDLDPDDFACQDVRIYQAFLKLLGFADFHDVFFHVPEDTCYEHGVFGLADFGSDRRSMVEYLLQRQGISRESCPEEQMTVIHRKYRRILNEDDLVMMAKKTGYENVQVVSLERLTVEEQIGIMACTTILVGVQGAGLQWAVFMRPGSTLVEISWPEKHWGYYFNSYVTPYNIDVKTVRVRNEDVRLNWVSYQDNVRRGAPVSAAERVELAKSPPLNDLDNIWKWADVVVDSNYFKYAIIARTFYKHKAKDNE